MKRRYIVIFLFLTLSSLLIFILYPRKLKDSDDFIKKARTVIPISDAQTVMIDYAGMVIEHSDALMWFISGNENQEHYYLPMECSINNDGTYTYCTTYEPIIRADDVGVAYWKNGYCFLVNNPKCKYIRIRKQSGQEIEVEINKYPYIYNSDDIPREYVFLDSNKKELPFSEWKYSHKGHSRM